MDTYATREQWLQAGIEALRPLFAAIKYPLPDKVRATIGWPSKGGLSRKRVRLGECWSIEASKDGVSEIFINPRQDDPIDILDVLAHELVHAAVGCKCGHKGKFVKCCNEIGLTEGKPTNAHANDKLREVLKGISKSLGNLPHAALNVSSNKKPQGTRLLKAECLDCGYVIRVTKKWADIGMPICPCGEEFELAV